MIYSQFFKLKFDQSTLKFESNFGKSKTMQRWVKLFVVFSTRRGNDERHNIENQSEIAERGESLELQQILRSLE